MSVDSQQLERTALERKDREELSTIAIALGGKPSSRARKAEIVDLILELTGVTSPASETTGNGSTEAKPKRTRKAKAETAEEPGDAEHLAAAGEGEPTVADAEPAGAATPEGQVDTAAPSASAGEEDAGTAQRSSQESPAASEGQEGRADNGDRERRAPGQGNRGEGQREEPEPGNRRRRRRGRDRDRDRGERQEEAWQGEPVEVEGYLDLRDEGYGFLRLRGYLPSKDDAYVSVKQVRQFGLRKGDHIKGAARPAGRNEKNPALLRIDLVNGADPEQARQRPRFEDLTPLFPDEKLRLETPNDPTNMTARIIDLIAPIGKGQRGLIVSPPKAGKTTVMKQIARSIETNNPEVHLIVLLVDERPEEVTDMRRWVRGEVAASTFDRPSDEHTMVAELTIERAKRMVEEGKDVVIILDGITRLARAYNLAAPATGRIMSGGIDTGALYPPKKFFGAARNIEEGGSLTILATALVETGSKMDEVIFEEFKGTGNMELRLDRKLAERRIYPAIDVDGSSTRHEELLFDRKQLQMVWKLRRVLSGLGEGGGGAGLEMLIDRLSTFKSNDEFLAEVAKAPSAGA
ncbi:transcription termination factor Rho [Rhabdothermincola sediminis]|uniref:transcription termination factor Rho n=1 Tax=Rhabdothermincola sediminis TaxID=2751370 RepID=UPI001AA0619B|nr:transcription termination factor Rho [Rhabdothermincola sediminis]